MHILHIVIHSNKKVLPDDFLQAKFEAPDLAPLLEFLQADLQRAGVQVQVSSPSGYALALHNASHSPLQEERLILKTFNIRKLQESNCRTQSIEDFKSTQRAQWSQNQ